MTDGEVLTRLEHLAAVAVLLLVGVELVELHDPSGRQQIFVNPSAITSIRQPLSINQPQFAKGTNCVVVMTNKNFIAVQEPCLDVRRKLRTAP